MNNASTTTFGNFSKITCRILSLLFVLFFALNIQAEPKVDNVGISIESSSVAARVSLQCDGTLEFISPCPSGCGTTTPKEGGCFHCSYCGNCTVDTNIGETCDPTVPVGGGGYVPNCRTANDVAPCTYCGDGNQDSSEECDLGSSNGAANSGCSSSCEKAPVCGNGIVEAGEACDKGSQNGVPGSGCSATCEVLPVCGNGIVEAGEACDKGALNGVAGSGCSISCTIAPYCGDGNLDAGEQCDDGNLVDGDGCSATCAFEPTCGDGTLDPGEQCDDGNLVDGDGCSATCAFEPYCGDGTKDAGEECDDGNQVNGDGCSADCTVEPYCGDGVKDPGEECDLGDKNGQPGYACHLNCTLCPVCGDGVKDPGEACDDGNLVDGDGCSKYCELEPICGDGTLDPGEQCDDGNLVNGDGCSSTCAFEPYCGDGTKDAGEECDDGNLVDGDGCSATCELEPYCGDGNLDPGEACDDGNLINGDGCSSTCEFEPYCGDGNLDPGEQCDDGNLVDGDGCSSTCEHEPICGDGTLDPGEQCDDGNLVNGDGCSSTCEFEPACGDGHLDPGEQCDDGNLVDGDGCSATCEFEPYCGDGVKDPGEECDLGDKNGLPGYACHLNCTYCPVCGDGVKDPGEQCDDGNLVDGDGCSRYCTLEPVCGDGTLDPGEQCDDGNLVDGDGCSATCEFEPACGDGNLDPGEACDDGNLVDGDGCSATCTFEPVCGDGNLDPGEQCDDGNLINGDGCSSTCTFEPICGDGKVDPGEQCDDGNNNNDDGCTNSCQNQCQYYRVNFDYHANYNDWKNQKWSNQTVVNGDGALSCFSSIFNQLDITYSAGGYNLSGTSRSNVNLSYGSFDDDAVLYGLIKYVLGSNGDAVLNQYFSLALANQTFAGAITALDYLMSQTSGYFLDRQCNPVQLNNYNASQVCGNIDASAYISPVSLDFGEEEDSWTTTQFKLSPEMSDDHWVVWKASAKRPLLVYDPKHTGVVTDGRQLFGNWTFGGKNLIEQVSMGSKATNMWANGYEALATLDVDGDGYLKGAELDDIALWFDKNQDAVSDAGEVISAAEAGITSINTSYDYKDSISGDIHALAGYERNVAGEVTEGASLDWFTGIYPNKQNAFSELQRVSGKDKAPKVASDVVISDFNKSTAAAADLTGVWHWESVNDSSTAGLFGFVEKLGKVTGNSVIEERLAENEKGLRGHLQRFPLKGETFVQNGKVQLKFRIEAAAGSVTNSVATYNQQDDTLSGSSTMTYDGKSIKYHWIAKRVFPPRGV